jgi:hypothetical protein
VDRLEPADAVVVLDGDRPRRLAHGVALAATGWAPVLVVIRCDSVAPELLAPSLPFDVMSFTPEPSTTRGEARGVARLAHEFGWRRLLIVTSTYHVTRARLIFRRALTCELGFWAAGVAPARLPRHLASEWAKLALALVLRRAP